ncbi:unnamed protein product [Cylicostephanus goldi]|uniref:DUF7087 domain-containing protein n=1 Tax=Cylicostephanus goldi TaxID=71465 RepID=A0A3P6R6I0_CYLGO|nr:unnamed protein product [Cylicostephanus goldi]
MRGVQFLCCVSQILMIYCESGSVNMVYFVIYNILCAMYTMHILRRWYYNIDGRFDLRQLIREPEYTVKVQYSIALFTPTVLSIMLYTNVELYDGLIRFFWALACICEILLAFGLLVFEAYEVFAIGN